MGLLSTFFGRFVDGKANLPSICEKVQKVVILSRRDGPNAAYRRSRFRDRISEPSLFFSIFSDLVATVPLQAIYCQYCKNGI